MRYLLDTNVIWDLVRHPKGLVQRRIEDIGEARICTSIIVAAELRFGVARKGSGRLAAQVDLVLSRIPVLPLEHPADDAYAQVRLHLERNGRVISANDLFIAAHALALDCTLVTDNMAEFARVPDLRCENWLR